MTAEIAIMNKTAVALAADSAVTIHGYGRSKHKIYQSAIKIFSLEYELPIGIMIFNNAEFMDIPWETIIKEFRREVRARDSVEDYWEQLRKFLCHNMSKFIDEERSMKKLIISLMYDFLEFSKHDKVEIFYKLIENQPKIEGISENTKKKWTQIAYEVSSSPSTYVPQNILTSFDQEKKEKFLEIASLLSDRFHPSYSGIVIAGFGQG